LIVRGNRFVPDAWDADLCWRKQDRRTLQRISALITDTAREPFAGIGKPEPLRGNLSGYGSRGQDLDEATLPDWHA
jgi:toxin YoeB